MWPFDKRRAPRTHRPYSAYLQGRRRACGLIADVEAGRFLAESRLIAHRIAFVLGTLCEVDAPLPTEAEVEHEVARRLAPSEAPPARPDTQAVPVSVAEEKTERVRPAPAPAPWIGDPLPSARR